MSDKTKRFAVLISLIVGAIVLSIVVRAFPHIPNVAPIAAIGLFSAAYFKNKKWAILVTFLALFSSDLVLQIQYWRGVNEYPGFYNNMIFVYGAFAAIIGIGYMLRNRVNALNVSLAAIGGSTLFYLISNFGVWLMGTMYAKSFAGLIECYAAGIPFYKLTFFGDLAYTAILFGAFGLILQNKKSWKLAPVKARRK